jgi:hypothetical protein
MPELDLNLIPYLVDHGIPFSQPTLPEQAH